MSKDRGEQLLREVGRTLDHEFMAATESDAAFRLPDGGAVCTDWDGSYLVYSAKERGRLVQVMPTVVTGRSEHVLASYQGFDDGFPARVQELVSGLGEELGRFLDTSEGSVEAVERYVRELGPSEALEGGRFESLVAFFGEVVRDRRKGSWKMVDAAGVLEPSILRRDGSIHSVGLAVYREVKASNGGFCADAVLV